MGNKAAIGIGTLLPLRGRVTSRTRCVLIVSLSVALIGAMSTLALSVPAAASQSVSLPASIASNCGSGDSTTALSEFLAGVPANSTVTFPERGCFSINETLLLQGTTGLTIEGNGSTLKQTASRTSPAPLVELWNDANLTIEHLNIDGAYNGSNGGEGEEGDYGIEFEADSGVTLTNDAVSNIQGDFLYFSPPYEVTTSDALSTGITITNSTFTNAGYHGLTVESVGCPTLAPCNGLTISNDTFRNVGTDAMDFEYDDYSTPFNADGTPFWAAQDDVTIENSTWVNWRNDWFASVQGQTPGVQAQHLTLSDNTLEGDGSIFEVVGTNPGATTAPYTNAFWTITGNHFATGYYGEPYRGGTTVAGQLYNISDLQMTGNTFPLCAWTYEEPQPASACAAPDEYVFDFDVITGGTIENNNFAGALGIAKPQLYDQYLTGMTECGNTYGLNAGQLDSSCSSTQPPGRQGSPWFRVPRHPHGDWWTVAPGRRSLLDGQ
jgi:hypothetical protein